MRSFSFLPSRLILVPSAPSHTPFYLSVPHHPRQPIQSHALVPFRPTSSSSALQSHALLPFRPTSSSSAHPVTYPCTIPSHVILVNPSSHTPFYLSVSRHPRQPIQSHALVPFRPTSSSSTHPVTRPCTIPSHLCVFSPPCPRPSGKVPGFSAKTVHFPPRHETSGEVQQSLLGKVPSIQAL